MLLHLSHIIIATCTSLRRDLLSRRVNQRINSLNDAVYTKPFPSALLTTYFVGHRKSCSLDNAAVPTFLPELSDGSVLVVSFEVTSRQFYGDLNIIHALPLTHKQLKWRCCHSTNFDGSTEHSLCMTVVQFSEGGRFNFFARAFRWKCPGSLWVTSRQFYRDLYIIYALPLTHKQLKWRCCRSTNFDGSTEHSVCMTVVQSMSDVATILSRPVHKPYIAINDCRPCTNHEPSESLDFAAL